MARKFGANCSKCQRSTEQQQSIKCFKIHGKDLLQNNDFHITSSIFLLSSVLVFYFFLILFFNSIVYRFFIARIFGVLPEYFRDWGGCRPPRPPGSYAYDRDFDKLEGYKSKQTENMLAEAAGPDQRAARKMMPGHCTKKIHPGNPEVTFLGTDTSFAQSHLVCYTAVFSVVAQRCVTTLKTAV